MKCMDCCDYVSQDHIANTFTLSELSLDGFKQHITAINKKVHNEEDIRAYVNAHFVCCIVNFDGIEKRYEWHALYEDEDLFANPIVETIIKEIFE
jgi:hypothetical protein